MEKTILVTGKDTFLGNEISLFFLNQGCRTAVTVTAMQESFPDVQGDRNFLVFPWNRRSAISAKNCILRTQHDLGPIDEAWILITPEQKAPGNLADMTASELDETLDHQTKGCLFLTRELLSIQAARPEIQIHFVFSCGDKSLLTPLEALRYQGLRAFADTLLAQAKKKGLMVWAYENVDGPDEAFASFVLQTSRLTDVKNPTQGKWHLYQAKKNPFQNLFRHKD